MKKHVLDVRVAQLVGTNAALILENISYWCEHNAANNTNLHDGHYWTYNSTKAFGELFPYMTVNVIRTALKKLKDNGLILTGNFNKSAYDRTTWYTLTEKAEAMLDVNVHSDEPNKEETTVENPTPSPTPAQDPWASTPNATPEQFQTPIAEPEPKPQPKKTRKTKSFDDIINAYTNDPQTKDLLGAWLQNRKAKRAAMTDRAIQGCIGKLDRCAQESRMSVNDYLDEVVCRGWSAFFPIGNYQNNGYQQKPRQQSQQPHWDLTEEELRRQKESDDEWLRTCVF
nr:MAG: Replication initiator protein A (RepA) N-terminus [Bacteriophage sp.]